MPPETPIAPVAPEAEMPEAELEVEVPVAPDVAVAVAADAIQNPAPEAAPAVDMAEMDALRGQVASLTSACDMERGRAAAAEALVGPLQAEVASLQAKLADYELGAALSGSGLPSQAGPMIRQLYANSLSAGKPQPIAAWLASYMGTPEGAALSLLKGQPSADPRASASPVGGSSPSHLTPLPTFLRPTR